MALATTCPQCKTSFKVVPDQLKLRRGLVRCGVCQHVFSGIDHLRYVDDAARAAQRAARERAAANGSGSGPANGPVNLSGSGTAGAGIARVDLPSTAAAARASTPGAAPEAPSPPGTAPQAPTPASATPRQPGAAIASADRTATPPDTSTPAPPGGRPARDPSAAAAGIARERASLDTTGPDRMADGPSPGRSVPAPARAETTALIAGQPLPAATPPAPETARPVPHGAAGAAPEAARAASVGGATSPPADVRPNPTGASGAPTPPWSAPGAAASGPATGAVSGTAEPAGSALGAFGRPARDAGGPPSRLALPAPDASRVPLDDLLSSPAASWPPAAGPQTILAADDDLKTAFFLTDSSFGPLPGEASSVMPPTSIHRPGGQAETVTRIHGEPTSGATRPPATPPASGSPPPIAAPALPGLALRPERGATDDTIDAAPAFVPVPPPPFAPAPRRADPPPPEPAIDYFPGSRRRSRSLGLALSPAAWAAAIGLTLLLGLQALVGWRDAIAARAPLVAPTLAGLLGPFGLEPRPPRELDALTIEGFELQASGTPNVLTLSAVLRNRSAHVVGYPAMELTLTDSAGALIVRKVIPPDLYVGDPATIGAGLAARSERPLRLALQHDGLQPTGFAVALFYP